MRTTGTSSSAPGWAGSFWTKLTAWSAASGDTRNPELSSLWDCAVDSWPDSRTVSSTDATVRRLSSSPSPTSTADRSTGWTD